MPKPWWREVLETVVYALVLAILLRTFIIQAFWIPSGSMIPTLEPGDRVLVLKFWYKFPIIEYSNNGETSSKFSKLHVSMMKPKRGQVVVFKYPIDTKRDFVKRLIGLPGDTIEIDNEARVFVNGEVLDEFYTINEKKEPFGPVVVPAHHYFFLGDNRSNSQDSRFWASNGNMMHFVPEGYLKGPVIFRYWPLRRMGRVR